MSSTMHETAVATPNGSTDAAAASAFGGLATPEPRHFSGRMAATAAIAGLVFAVLGGCGDDDEPTAAEANADLCQARDELASTLDQLPEIDATTTRSELEDAAEEIGDAVDEVKDAADEVSSTEADELRAAAEDFADTVRGLDSAESIEAAGQELASSGSAVVAAFRALFERAGC